VIAPAADRSAIVEARQRETQSALTSTRAHGHANAGFRPRDRKRLCRAIRAGVSRLELLAVILCRYERQSPERAAATLRLTVPAVRELLASYRGREKAAERRRERDERTAAWAGRQQSADPVRVRCPACRTAHTLLLGDPATCQECLGPLPLTAAQRRTIKANAPSQTTANGPSKRAGRT
jgi:hypothetical protein